MVSDDVDPCLGHRGLKERPALPDADQLPKVHFGQWPDHLRRVEPVQSHDLPAEHPVPPKVVLVRSATFPVALGRRSMVVE
jgi:hypothetical protein